MVKVCAQHNFAFCVAQADLMLGRLRVENWGSEYWAFKSAMKCKLTSLVRKEYALLHLVRCKIPGSIVGWPEYRSQELLVAVRGVSNVQYISRYNLAFSSSVTMSTGFPCTCISCLKKLCPTAFNCVSLNPSLLCAGCIDSFPGEGEIGYFCRSDPSRARTCAAESSRFSSQKHQTAVVLCCVVLGMDWLLIDHHKTAWNMHFTHTGSFVNARVRCRMNGTAQDTHMFELNPRVQQRSLLLQCWSLSSQIVVWWQSARKNCTHQVFLCRIAWTNWGRTNTFPFFGVRKAPRHEILFWVD